MSQPPQEDLIERMVGRHGKEVEDAVRDTVEEYTHAIEGLQEQHRQELIETRRAVEESTDTESNVAMAWGAGIGLLGSFSLLTLCN